MIVGIGLDLVSLPEFTPLLDSDSGFVEGTYSRNELAYQSSTPPAQQLAGFFAAKEAFIKAWSSARPHESPMAESVKLDEIEIAHDDYGRPQIQLAGTVESLFVRSMANTAVQVSLSHEPNVAGAVVILTRSP